MSSFSLDSSALTSLCASFPQADADGLRSLVAESGYLDGDVNFQLNPSFRRQDLGNFHKALSLNSVLDDATDNTTYLNVIKIIHNAALRIVNFIDSVLKLNPNLCAEDSEKEFTFKKADHGDFISYILKHKSGYMFELCLTYDQRNKTKPTHYKIEIQDSNDIKDKVVIQEGETNTKEASEKLCFDFLLESDEANGYPEEDLAILNSIRNHTYDNTETTETTEEDWSQKAMLNIRATSEALNAATTRHDLFGLELDSSSEPIKKVLDLMKELKK